MVKNTTGKLVDLGAAKQVKEDKERAENVERLKHLLQRHIDTLTENPYAFDSLVILALSDDLVATQYDGNMNYYEVIGAIEACKYSILHPGEEDCEL